MVFTFAEEDMVTGRLRIHDLLLVRKLQTAGLQLDLRRAVLSPSTPLTAALKSTLLPGYGNRVTSVIVDDHAGGHYLHGFIQARDRTGRPEQDIVFLAPLLSSGNGVIWTWQRLLNKVCALGSSRGIQRIFVQIPEEQTAEIEVFRQAGFSIYAKDRVYCHSRSHIQAPTATRAVMQWRRMQSVDRWGLQKLNNLITPAIVQHAEGVATGGTGQNHWGLWQETQATDIVLPGDDQEILGYARICKGSQGYWFKMILHPQVCDQADTLVQQALSNRALVQTRLPIYCDVREYEDYVASALQRNGFDEVLARTLMVKSMTVPVREPRRILVPALERQAEQIPTA